MQSPPKQNNLIFNSPPPDCVLCLSGLPGGGNAIHDRSSRGNHGAITGAAWEKLPGGLWCLDFDGVDDCVTVNDGGSLDFGEDSFSIRLWLCLEGEHGDIIGKYQSAQPGRWGLSAKSASTIRFYNAAGSVEVAVGDLSGRWQSLSFVIDTKSGSIYIYQQGKLRSSGVFSPNTTSNSISLTIGRFTSEQWGCLQGKIALCSIHRRALDALEIQNYFNSEKHFFGAWQK